MNSSLECCTETKYLPKTKNTCQKYWATNGIGSDFLGSKDNLNIEKSEKQDKQRHAAKDVEPDPEELLLNS